MTTVQLVPEPSDRAILIARLRSEICGHLESLGLESDTPAGGSFYTHSKEGIRASYAHQRQALIRQEYRALGHRLPSLLRHFATGAEVEPEHIDPELVVVNSDDETGLLFRLATTLWSVPVSRGFGRRIRYLVRDRYNDKLIGLFALGDPVFNLRDRDRWVGWTVNDRRLRLVNVMDAYVVGAVPPYNQLLCGKLVASLMGSQTVVDEFSRRYSSSTGIISGRSKSAKLVLITVTSALGRSSLYNRIRIPDVVALHRIGETQGWGHFHMADEQFMMMRQLLALDDHPYAFGVIAQLASPEAGG